MTTHIHLVKLSVGTEGVDDLEAWQKLPQTHTADGLPRHVTRMWPKREPQILAGGSIYWVIKGQIQARQRILRLEEVDRGDGIRRCAIVLDPHLIRTASALRRPFQGWRYLKPEDAPKDLPQGREGDDALPPELSAALADIGLL
ncbi:DUF1489 domain-containing protein [Litorivita sp. NS0012-18]|uniref:DUF1489 family protein n=1 Tax=Litorivita sp. NS0012-18 TaxID=3127655 RepID=UPI0031050036